MGSKLPILSSFNLLDVNEELVTIVEGEVGIVTTSISELFGQACSKACE